MSIGIAGDDLLRVPRPDETADRCRRSTDALLSIERGWRALRTPAFPMLLRRMAEKFASTPLRTFCAAVAFLITTLAVSSGLSDELRVERVRVLERGIFHASSGNKPISQSNLGVVANVRDISLVRSTTTIPARKSLRFGVRYVIAGLPLGASVELRLVTIFPQAGLLDPVAGVRHYKSEYTIAGAIGVPAYREFMFDQSWEIVAGEWLFEFWQGGRKLGSESFCILDAESMPHQSDSKADCEFLIGRTKSGESASRATSHERLRVLQATIEDAPCCQTPRRMRPAEGELISQLRVEFANALGGVDSMSASLQKSRTRDAK